MKGLLRTITLTFAIVGCTYSFAQDGPGGKMYFADVEAFNQPGPGQGVPRYFRCGNAPSVNIPFAITMEAWVKLAIPTDNQKIMGKVDANAGAVFNDGYLLGITNSRLAPEIWTPNNNTFNQGFIPPISAWHHVAITYQVGGMYSAYLDGKMVYETNAGNQAIVNDDTEFIIGIAPWDLASFMTFGHVDEVRLWSVARSAEQIKEYMFRNLEGNEFGLALYLNFDNDDGGDVINDLSIEANHCDKVNMDNTNIVSSTCIVADETTQVHEDLMGLWFGNSESFLDPRTTFTDNGLSMSYYFAGQDSTAYVVWGHNGESGVSLDNMPVNAPANAKRTKRVWHATAFETIKPSFIFDLEDAAGGGEMLPNDKPANHYTLLERIDGAITFSPVAFALEKNENTVTFNWVPAKTGYYALAVGDAPFDGVVNTVEIGQETTDFQLFPNPNHGTFVLSGVQAIGQPVLFEIFNINGQNIRTLNIENFPGQISLALDQTPGTYLLKWTSGTATGTQRFLIQ